MSDLADFLTEKRMRDVRRHKAKVPSGAQIAKGFKTSMQALGGLSGKLAAAGHGDLAREVDELAGRLRRVEKGMSMTEEVDPKVERHAYYAADFIRDSLKELSRSREHIADLQKVLRGDDRVKRIKKSFDEQTDALGVIRQALIKIYQEG